MKVINKGKNNIQVLLPNRELGMLKIGYALELDKEIAESLLKMYPNQVVTMDSLLVSPEAKVMKDELEEKEKEIARLKKVLNKKELPESYPDLDALKEKATEMGIEFSPNIGAKTLKARIEAEEKEAE